MKHKNRIYSKEIDLNAIVDIEECKSEDLRRENNSGLTFWKLFGALFLAGLSLFVVIGSFMLYGMYQTSKAMEREAAKMEAEFEKSLEKTFRSIKAVSTTPSSDVPVIYKQDIPWAERPPIEGYVKDADGVWRSPQESSSDVYYYKDRDGVWRNSHRVESIPQDKPDSNLLTQEWYEKEVFGDILRESKMKVQENESRKKTREIIEKMPKQSPFADGENIERFNPSKAGEIKSEWEAFKDPR